MIRITSAEHIKTQGDFKLDGLQVTDFHLEYPKTKGGKQKLTITLTPFAYLDDGTAVYDPDVTLQLYVPDAAQYLAENPTSPFLSAYFATEAAISNLVNEQKANYGWTTVFEAPQA